MIAAFTPHADTGKYHYPLERENENPFTEAEILFKATSIEATLLGQRIAKNMEVFMGWLFLQYLSNPKFREQVPAFKPELNIESSFRFSLGLFEKTHTFKVLPTQETLLAGFQSAWITNHPQVRKYLMMLAASQPSAPLQPGERAFTFLRQDGNIPAGTRMVLSPAQYQIKTYDGEQISAVIRAAYVPPNKIIPQRWFPKIQWEQPWELPDKSSSWEEQMSRLSQLPPSPEVHAALCSLLVEIGKTPMPTNTAELHQLMATLRKVYGVFWSHEVMPQFWFPVYEPRLKIWTLTNLRPRSFRDDYYCGQAAYPTIAGDQTHQIYMRLNPGTRSASAANHSNLAEATFRLFFSCMENQSLPEAAPLVPNWSKYQPK